MIQIKIMCKNAIDCKMFRLDLIYIEEFFYMWKCYKCYNFVIVLSPPEFLQPYKPRPETSAQVARNLVAGALGLRNNVSKEKRDEERKKLAQAKGMSNNGYVLSIEKFS